MMTPMKALILAGLAGALAACSPATDSEPDAPAPAANEAGTEALDAAALHELLLAQAGSLVPSDWHTGAPAPDTALAYWHLPESDVVADRTAACTPLAEPDDAFDCTLTFTGTDDEADPEDRRTVTARYRFDVRQNDDGRLELVSPNVRWAVTG